MKGSFNGIYLRTFTVTAIIQSLHVLYLALLIKLSRRRLNARALKAASLENLYIFRQSNSRT
jgi:hypothetical protein